MLAAVCVAPNFRSRCACDTAIRRWLNANGVHHGRDGLHWYFYGREPLFRSIRRHRIA
ncbi:hypothetical protein CBM2592_A60042 [Cupriavidus taiwanensis]|nr:hypothetical protein CBM2588_A40045 [Cupriavidus taiwanensis]SOY54919.1 hypothetical protein CBM2592_A60042 [Cupriavidus taiwanensis]SOY88009.1 hypothetical protein CBM2591_A50041 [Cupriavidus taiwanensis]SOZ24666.1 hypothetical protein CBM2608_A50010 [Cupriavidus taiwanensis]SOZ61282.1 hypothetical protein CBM2617_A40042 [Cupriavidus taiwanensis]